MFGFFKSKEIRELDKILDDLKNYLANNYKDQAHDARKRLGSRCEELFAEGKIKEKQYQYYSDLYHSYTEKMKNYRH